MFNCYTCRARDREKIDFPFFKGISLLVGWKLYFIDTWQKHKYMMMMILLNNKPCLAEVLSPAKK